MLCFLLLHKAGKGLHFAWAEALTQQWSVWAEHKTSDGSCGLCMGCSTQHLCQMNLAEKQQKCVYVGACRFFLMKQQGSDGLCLRCLSAAQCSCWPSFVAQWLAWGEGGPVEHRCPGLQVAHHRSTELCIRNLTQRCGVGLSLTASSWSWSFV